MPYPTGLQLYSLRKELEADFVKIIKRVAKIGYAGVETAGISAGKIYGYKLEDAAKLFGDLDLAVPSAHISLSTSPNELVDSLAILGCKRAIVAHIPEAELNDETKIKESCDRLNALNKTLRGRGLTVGYHNHWWEFGKVGGRRVYDIMNENLDPSIFWEFDTYWIQTAKEDPAEVVKLAGKRAPFLHIKDGPAVKNKPMVAVGSGKMNIPAIVEGASAEWLIVELDECATDMMEAVEQSFKYLTGKGLGRGNKS